MAYVPPHRRPSRDGDGPSLTPEPLAPLFKRSLSLKTSKDDNYRTHKIFNANPAVREWLAVGLKADRDILSSVTLRLAPVDADEQRAGWKSFKLFPNHPAEYGESAEANAEESLWSPIAKLVLPHLISSFQVLKRISEVANEVEIKPELVAQIGKILFHGSHNMRVEDARSWVSASSLKSSKRTFNTCVPSAYKKDVTDVVVPLIGFETEDEKDIYHVKISDKLRSDAIISCKCRLVKEEQKLQLYKVELTVLRHMVVDLSCLDKDLDMRLMLYAKRTMKSLSDEELTFITDLVGSAIIDPDVKGGLRWPLGMNSSGCRRFDVIGVWHLISKSYRNPSFKLKVEQADRFDFRQSFWEVTCKVTLKMREIARVLWEQNLEADLISDMLEKSLKLIWENFLRSEHPVLEKFASV